MLQVHDVVMAAMLASEPELYSASRMHVPHRTNCFEVCEGVERSLSKPHVSAMYAVLAVNPEDDTLSPAACTAMLIAVLSTN